MWMLKCRVFTGRCLVDYSCCLDSGMSVLCALYMHSQSCVKLTLAKLDPTLRMDVMSLVFYIRDCRLRRAISLLKTLLQRAEKSYLLFVSLVNKAMFLT